MHQGGAQVNSWCCNTPWAWLCHSAALYLQSSVPRRGQGQRKNIQTFLGGLTCSPWLCLRPQHPPL